MEDCRQNDFSVLQKVFSIDLRFKISNMLNIAHGIFPDKNSSHNLCHILK